MAQSEKKRALKEQGAFNRQSAKITDQIFQSNSFFDPHDLVQVKYEMLRQVTHEGKSVSDAATAFGMSRPTFYQAKEALEQQGVLGLAPKKTGPKNRHKLNDEVMAFIEAELTNDSALDPQKIVEIVRKKFRLTIHKRSVERALAAQKKICTTSKND